MNVDKHLKNPNKSQIIYIAVCIVLAVIVSYLLSNIHSTRKDLIATRTLYNLEISTRGFCNKYAITPCELDTIEQWNEKNPTKSYDFARENQLAAERAQKY